MSVVYVVAFVFLFVMYYQCVDDIFGKSDWCQFFLRLVSFEGRGCQLHTVFVPLYLLLLVSFNLNPLTPVT